MTKLRTPRKRPDPAVDIYGKTPGATGALPKTRTNFPPLGDQSHSPLKNPTPNPSGPPMKMSRWTNRSRRNLPGSADGQRVGAGRGRNPLHRRRHGVQAESLGQSRRSQVPRPHLLLQQTTTTRQETAKTKNYRVPEDVRRGEDVAILHFPFSDSEYILVVL